MSSGNALNNTCEWEPSIVNNLIVLTFSPETTYDIFLDKLYCKLR